MNWEQLRAILWLRWRLSKNQFIRAKTLNAVISIIFTVVLIMAGVAACVGGLVGGWFAGAKAQAPVLLIILDALAFAFLVFWGTGLMVEIQRSESLDLPKLLHLPISLRQVFIFNYVVSHLSPMMALVMPGLMGFCVGLTLGSRGKLGLMIPVAAAFVFLITAWTYCLRGWLAALMLNKRRRRAIIVWVTVVFVLLCQLPNFVFNSPLFRKAARKSQAARLHPGPEPQHEIGGLALPEGLVTAHLALPPGWLGYSAMRLKEGSPWPALGAIAGSALLGVLGLGRAYRMTLRFYQGVESGRAAAPPKPRVPAPASALRPMLVERHLPFLPDDAAALVLATFRSLLRAPELKMAFIGPVIVGLLMASAVFSMPKHASLGKWSLLIETGAVAFAAMSLAPTMGNAFGLDRNGFRALVLLPTPRHFILLAKNLAIFPFMACVSILLLALVAILTGVSWVGLAIGLVQTPIVFLLASLFCNLTSILAPFRMAAGTLQAQKPKPIVFAVAFATLLVAPLTAPIILIPPGLQLLFATFGWIPWLPVGLIAAFVILALVAWVYWLLLPLQGRLLQRREQTILLEVTEDVE